MKEESIFDGSQANIFFEKIGVKFLPDVNDYFFQKLALNSFTGNDFELKFGIKTSGGGIEAFQNVNGMKSGLDFISGQFHFEAGNAVFEKIKNIGIQVLTG